MMNYYNFYDEDGIYATIQTTSSQYTIERAIEKYKETDEDGYSIEGFMEYLEKTDIQAELIITQNIYF